MKKLTLFVALLMLFQLSFAGGILTNTNQSAQYVRMLSRNASTQLDAIYFNPAGIMKMDDGFHLGIHNQSIFQTRTITSEFWSPSKEYIGKISAPVFPDLYAAWKNNKFALSFMFGPVGGGGGATYDDGLPSFEKQIAIMPSLLTLKGIPTTGYSSNIFFEGTSVFWGAQLSGSYAINDIISVSAGARFIMANNTYNGYIRNIQINPNQPAFGADYNGTNMVSAPQFFGDASTVLSALSAGATAYASGLQPIVSGGGGEVLLVNGGIVGLTAAQIAQIQGILGAAGLSPQQIAGINIQTAQGTLSAAAPGFSENSALMAGYVGATSDVEVDTKQTGTGITPLFGINISPVENLNIGIKYEFKTVLELTNETKEDGTGMFPDEGKSNSDMPALLMAGVEYKFSDKFLASVSFNEFFDKGVDWGTNVYGQERTIDKNSWELALGLQYNITDNFAVSIGGMQSTTGVTEQYQSDFSYSNSSNTGAIGFEWKLNKALTLDAGMLYTAYKDFDKSFDGYKETYDKENIGFAVGITYSIF